ncbi:MAG: discoidin domain-containing protein, partial [bacterium]|nr:discoidin domain-containing protein [bacterium]
SNVISYNNAKTNSGNGGAGIYLSESSPEIINCTIYLNVSEKKFEHYVNTSPSDDICNGGVASSNTYNKYDGGWIKYNFTPDLAFDNVKGVTPGYNHDVFNSWCSEDGRTTDWIQYNLTSKKTIAGISLQAVNNSESGSSPNMPRNIKIYGSNESDFNNRTLFATIQFTVFGKGEKKIITFSEDSKNKEEYRYYRMDVSNSIANLGLAISEIELFEIKSRYIDGNSSGIFCIKNSSPTITNTIINSNSFGQIYKD